MLFSVKTGDPMMDAFSTPKNRTWTFILLATCGLLGFAAAAVGIDDNLPGILLAFLAITSFVLAFAHPWRTSKPYLRLLYASLIGLVVFGILQAGFDILLSNSEGTGIVIELLSALAALCLIALLL